MKITATQTFKLEDFDAKSRSLIQKLVSPLNKFIEQVVQALTKQLTLRENFKAQVIEVTVLPGQGYPIKQSYELNEKPTAVIIGGIRESTGATPAAAYSPHWVYNGKDLALTFIGLDPAKTYYVTLVCMV